MNIGIAIRKIRKEKTPKLNQTEFAKLIGITQTYLSQIETGAKTPSIDVVQNICSKLEIPMAIFFWLGVEESDIRETKRESFRIIKPTIDAMINSIM